MDLLLSQGIYAQIQLSKDPTFSKRSAVKPEEFWSPFQSGKPLT